MSTRLKSRAGFTLVEVMVAVSIISIAFLAAVSTFNTITNAIQSTKNRTLATNLAQEKIQILRQISYNRLMVTPSPSYRTDLSTTVAYDTAYYPPEAILEGGVMYERLTYVQMAAEVGNVLKYFGSTPDTGMKAVTVSVVWTQRNEKKLLQIKSVIANPDTIKLSAGVAGTVKKYSSAQPIEGANIFIAENIAWRSASASDGSYLIKCFDGTHTLYAEARGYFPQSRKITLGENEIAEENFALVAMASGTARGYAWLNNGPVISQVVGSTLNASTVFDQEYVELFNPTTSAWVMATGANSGVFGLKYKSTGDDDSDPPTTINLDYVTLAIPPQSYYLAANTTTIIIGGIARNADAVWNTATDDYPNVIKCKEDSGPTYAGGGVGIYRISDGEWIDRAGWNRGVDAGGNKVAPIREGNGIPQPSLGLERGEQFVRKTSTGGIVGTFARCYDSHNNSDDFIGYKPLSYPPKNSSDSATVVAGKPAIGAAVSANDGLSYSVTASQTGSPPAAEFTLTSVATGQHIILITSGTLSCSLSSVTITSDGQVVNVPSADTVPSWPSADFHSAFINQELLAGYVSGKVTNALNAPISAPSPIKIRIGSTEVTANPTTGRYIAAVTPETYTVEANPNMDNSYYVSQTRDNVAVTLGAVTSGVDFVLSQGGSVDGWITRDGINPLPGISVTAANESGAVLGVGMSAQNGRFSILNISTGTRTIKPELDAKETSDPDEITANISLGESLFVGTFTVTDAFGRIAGNVRSDGHPISTGVMIFASTSSISASAPPVIVPNMPQIYYMTNSYENGTYALEVRGGSTLYNMAAFYPTVSGLTVFVSTRTASNIAVTPGVTLSDVNFDW
ncbi:MAG: hypothetical protein CVU77_05520 [Elusimicrobia bacterium HGW-Elusimicrobia-1]|nr:MAG: hypothetical protein CVU77_05520 [Elusimicrobia bacterium HGW-Elusimicrobia-1]